MGYKGGHGFSVGRALAVIFLIALPVFPNLSFAGLVDDFFNPSQLIDATIKSLDTLNSAIGSPLSTIPVDILKSTTSGLNSLDELRKQQLSIPDDDARRNISEIIRSRQFEAEEHDVITRDGYILTIQRIVNPFVDVRMRSTLKPVLLQHGLLSSAADWVLNSVSVRPEPIPQQKLQQNRAARQPLPKHILRNRKSLSARGAPITGSEQPATGAAAELAANEGSSLSKSERLNSLGFYLANQGYDVFLANSRGNTYGRRHVNLSAWDTRFWDFTFDELIEFDLRDTISFIQKLTNRRTIGYVGHSQGSAIMFGLLAEHPEYAKYIEPFIALAPVAYVKNVVSPAKYFVSYTPYFQGVNLWFARSTLVEKYLSSIVCSQRSHRVLRRDICANIVFLGAGFDEEELDDSRIAAYLAHMPAGTSVKNLAHYGQELTSGRFAKYDHGPRVNYEKYGSTTPPDYQLDKIQSKSIVLFTADNDWLASPKDVSRLRQSLMVEPYRVYNISRDKPKWNHLDFMYAKHAGELVNTRILEVLKQFD